MCCFVLSGKGEFGFDAIELNPSFAEAYNNLCNALNDRTEESTVHPGDYGEAVSACEKVIELNASYAEPHKNLGDFYRDGGDVFRNAKISDHALRQYGFAAD